MDLMRLLEVTAYNHYLACLVGNPAPRVAAMYQHLTSPQVGDMVLETSTIYDESRVGMRFGRLVRVASEPMYTPEEWADGGSGPDEPIPHERVWYIELADGREFRWVNASFIAVPTEIARTGSRPPT